jgi:hypothetical protein
MTQNCSLLDEYTLYQKHRAKPQLIIRKRLVDMSETIKIVLYLPSCMKKGVLRIYPRFLEDAQLNENDEIPIELSTWLKDDKA